MTATSATRAFADAVRAMVQAQDVADTLSGLLTDCAALTAADALGLLVVSEPAGELEVLAATSHSAAELELHQQQRDLGPGPDTIRTGAQVLAGSAEEMTQRWGDVGRAIAAAGFQGIHSSPVRWRGRTFGALNAFQRAPGRPDDDGLLLAQAFADATSVIVLNSVGLTPDQFDDRIRTALEGRTVIEQAKGVLAYLNDVDTAAGYDLLTGLAARKGRTLTVAATEVVRRASRRREPPEVSPWA